MLKLKICLTVFILYEIAAVLLLHFPTTCDAMFAYSFCADSVFKYFIACIAVPALAFLIAMWIFTIVKRIRRRSFVYRARAALGEFADDVRRDVAGNVNSADLQKYIAAAVIGGIGRYMSKNPRARQMFEDIVGAVRNGNVDYHDVNHGDYDSEWDASSVTDDAHATRRASRQGRATAASSRSAGRAARTPRRKK